jgi:hypothetical protein
MVSAPVRPGTRDTKDVPRLPFRLRHVLAVTLFGVMAAWTWPRGNAAWRLHNLAVLHADYALCMVGPTGPDLLRADSGRFIELVRRRLVSVMPSEKPFARCQAFVERMEVDHATFRLHGAEAGEFTEYHNTPGGAGRYTLASLEVDSASLEALSAKAWPFIRGNSGRLMKPSSHAKEAPHVRVPEAPGLGTGLPATRSLYRSSAAFGDAAVVALGSGANARVLMSKNRGIDWAPGGRHLASEIQDRCVADDEGRAFTLSRMNDGRRIVVSQGPDGPPEVSALAPAEEEIAGISCDRTALVAALVLPKDASGRRPLRLRLCPYREACRDLGLPDTGRDRLYYPADIARLGGDTIVARTSGGITRVSSSRDDGRTWLPWTVAFDRASTGGDLAAPFLLLVVGDDVLLYSGARAGGSYPLLVSDDHGASFHAPERHPNGEQPESPERALAGAR